MSKLMSLIRRAPKRFSAIVAMVAAAILVPLAVNAWGPDRPTFPGNTPAPYPVFNSMTENPQVGDERNFVRIRESGTSEYINQVTFQPGKVYDVSVYFHNNAASNLNESGKGLAKNATLKMEVPNVVTAGVNAALTGTISASNTNPLKVWDEAYGKNATKGDIALRYVSNSATFVSQGAINGQKLPDTLFTTGAKLGYYGQDGTVPGCNEFSGFVNFKIRVDQPNFDVEKFVSVDNGKTWVDSAKATAGSTVLYGISYQNTGTNQQDNVSVRDILPQGVSYVPGSTYLMNSVTGGEFKKASDGITTVGYNAGSYQPKGNLFFKFSAKLPEASALKCGTNTLTNTARVTTNAGYKEDTATVTINKDCPKPVAKYTCNLLTVTTVDRTHFKFNTTYTAENATFKSATYVIKNAAGATVDTKTVSGTTKLDYAQATAGKYTVQVSLTFTVDGTNKTVTSDGCKSSFEVAKPPVKDITVCELATKKIVTIKEDQFDSKKYSKNLDDCKTPRVAIEKTVNGKEIAEVAVNEPYTYELTVKNTGELNLTNVKVTDPAPANVVFIKASVGTIANNKWEYTIPSLKIGESKSFTITAKVTKEVSDAIKNTACVDAPAVPGNPDDCDTATVVVPPKEKITVCELATKKLVTIKEDQFDSKKYSKNLDDCKETPVVKDISVCDLTTKQVITIKEDAFDATKHSTNLADCETTTPPELPHTGIGENIVAIVGLGALVASLGYYIASRRALS